MAKLWFFRSRAGRAPLTREPGAPSLRFLQGWGFWAWVLSPEESYQIVLICL